MDEYPDAISPKTAGMLLGLCALGGCAFMVGLYFVNKTPDGLYEQHAAPPAEVAPAVSGDEIFKRPTLTQPGQPTDPATADPKPPASQPAAP